MKITKITTENPLIDELVYNVKFMALETILKYQSKADEVETMDTLKKSDIYIACLEGKASSYFFEYTEEDLFSMGISRTDPNLLNYLNDPDILPEPIRSTLLKKKIQEYINNYEEENEYYRMLNGLPEYRAAYIPSEYIPILRDKIDVTKPLDKMTAYEIGIMQQLKILNNILTMTNTVLKSNIRGFDFQETKRIVYKNWLFVPEEYRDDIESYLLDMITPIHEFDEASIAAIDQLGIIAELKEVNPNAKYLDYLGSKKIGIYKARKARDFEPLYVPVVAATSVYTDFYDRLMLNRDFVLKTIYSDAYKTKSSYYDNFIALLIIILSMSDIVSSAPEYLIRRDLFDMRTIQYLLESYGVTFYPEIPLKYQQKLIKNLNRLLKYKSSPQCIKDICALFDLSDINIYKYYLTKVRVIEGDGSYNFVDSTTIYLTDTAEEFEVDFTGLYMLVDKEKTGFDRVWEAKDNNDKLIGRIALEKTTTETGESYDWYLYDSIDNKIATLNQVMEPEGDWVMLDSLATKTINTRFLSDDIDNCSLQFCRVLLDGSVEEHLRDLENYRDYYTVIANDRFWNGEQTREQVEQEILKQDFNYVKSKYLSLDTIYDMSEISLQRPYFFSMIFEKNKFAENLTVPVEKISPSKEFRFNDLVCYLLALSYLYYGIKDEINVNKQKILYLTGFDFEADIPALQQYIAENDKYLLDNQKNPIDLSNFTPKSRFASFETLVNYYSSNLDIRKELIERMNTADNKRIYDIYKKIYDATMIQRETDVFFRGYNYSLAGSGVPTYSDFVRFRDPVLGESYDTIAAMRTDDPERDSIISDIITSAVEAIEYYLNDDSIKYIFSNMASVSYEALTNYIKLLVNFFKSFTIQIAEINSIYKIHTPFDNKLSPIDNIDSMIANMTYKDSILARDRAKEIKTVKTVTDEIQMFDKLYINTFYKEEE